MGLAHFLQVVPEVLGNHLKLPVVLVVFLGGGEFEGFCQLRTSEGRLRMARGILASLSVFLKEIVRSHNVAEAITDQLALQKLEYLAFPEQLLCARGHLELSALPAIGIYNSWYRTSPRRICCVFHIHICKRR